MERWLPAAIVTAVIAAMFYALHADLSRLPPSAPFGYTQRSQQAEQERQTADNQPPQGQTIFDGVTLVDLATLILAGSTVGLWIVTGKSVRIAERALTEVERPYVFVFGAHWETIPSFEGNMTPPSLIYSIANYGKTPAIILDVQCALVISDAIPIQMRKGAFPLFNSPILQAGEVRSDLREGSMFTLDRGIDHIMVEDCGVYPIPKMAEDEQLFFRIIIDYRGAFSREHQSGFCWRYDKGISETFIQHGGVEYNYLK